MHAVLKQIHSARHPEPVLRVHPEYRHLPLPYAYYTHISFHEGTESTDPLKGRESSHITRTQQASRIVIRSIESMAAELVRSATLQSGRSSRSPSGSGTDYRLRARSGRVEDHRQCSPRHESCSKPAPPSLTLQTNDHQPQGISAASGTLNFRGEVRHH